MRTVLGKILPDVPPKFLGPDDYFCDTVLRADGEAFVCTLVKHHRYPYHVAHTGYCDNFDCCERMAVVMWKEE